MKLEDITDIAVIGAGIMGSGIAQGFAQAGFSVRLIDQAASALDGAHTQIQANLELLEAHGLLKDEIPDILERIKPHLLADLDTVVSGCQFVVESIPEVLDLKKALFARLGNAAPKEAILASNTGSLTMTPMADGVNNPQRVVGLHYFNPAHIIPAVEIHRAKQTSRETLDLTRALMVRAGKTPALVRKEVPGFIVNRLQGAVEREVDYLLDEGIVTPEDLDAVLKASYGFRLACLGPMEAEDVIGLDTAERVSDLIYKTLSNRTEAAESLREKVRRGELGIKSGKGWYDYSGRDIQEIRNDINTHLLMQLKVFHQITRKKEA